MRRRALIYLIASLGLLGAGLALYRALARLSPRSGREEEYMNGRTATPMNTPTMGEGTVCLPFPKLSGKVSLEEALRRRRSIRDYDASPLTVEEVSQLLWAAYGVTEVNWSLKTTPSAGGTYPLEVYLVIKEGGVSVGGGFLDAGVYRYDFRSHCIDLVRRGDFTRQLYEAALGQEWVREAALNIVITAVYERTTRRYGERGVRYVMMEAGHAAQNIYLQATALGLGTVSIGAFYDDDVKGILGDEEGEPLYIMPVGRPRELYDVTEEELRGYYEKNRA